MATFLERLDDEARNLLLAVARPVSYEKGARLVRHGDPSRGAYVVREGAAEATVTLPGGETLTVARLEAGGVFGEMALVERGTCTATVRATGRLEGWFIERDDFRSLVAQRVPAALRIQHALTLVLSEKLRALNAKVLDVPAPEDIANHLGEIEDRAGHTVPGAIWDELRVIGLAIAARDGSEIPGDEVTSPLRAFTGSSGARAARAGAPSRRPALRGQRFDTGAW